MNSARLPASGFRLRRCSPMMDAMGQQGAMDRKGEIVRALRRRQVWGRPVDRQHLHLFRDNPFCRLAVQPGMFVIVFIGTDAVAPVRIQHQDVARPDIIVECRKLRRRNLTGRTDINFADGAIAMQAFEPEFRRMTDHP